MPEPDLIPDQARDERPGPLEPSINEESAPAAPSLRPLNPGAGFSLPAGASATTEPVDPTPEIAADSEPPVSVECAPEPPRTAPESKPARSKLAPGWSTRFKAAVLLSFVVMVYALIQKRIQEPADIDRLVADKPRETSRESGIDPDPKPLETTNSDGVISQDVREKPARTVDNLSLADATPTRTHAPNDRIKHPPIPELAPDPPLSEPPKPSTTAPRAIDLAPVARVEPSPNPSASEIEMVPLAPTVDASIGFDPVELAENSTAPSLTEPIDRTSPDSWPASEPLANSSTSIDLPTPDYGDDSDDPSLADPITSEQPIELAEVEPAPIIEESGPDPATLDAGSSDWPLEPLGPAVAVDVAAADSFAGLELADHVEPSVPTVEADPTPLEPVTLPTTPELAIEPSFSPSADEMPALGTAPSIDEELPPPAPAVEILAAPSPSSVDPGTPIRQSPPAPAYELTSEPPVQLVSEPTEPTPGDAIRTVETPPGRMPSPTLVETPIEESAGRGSVAPITHVVQPRENFWTISQRYYGSGWYYRALWMANRERVEKVDELYVGTRLLIYAPEDLDRSLIPSTVPVPGRAPRPDGMTDPEAPREIARRDDQAERTSGAPLPGPASSRPISRQRSDRPTARPNGSIPLAPIERVHSVGPNETLRSIARDELGDSARGGEILRLNAGLIDDPDRLPIGARLILPEPAHENSPPNKLPVDLPR